MAPFQRERMKDVPGKLGLKVEADESFLPDDPDLLFDKWTV